MPRDDFKLRLVPVCRLARYRQLDKNPSRDCLLVYHNFLESERINRMIQEQLWFSRLERQFYAPLFDSITDSEDSGLDDFQFSTTQFLIRSFTFDSK